MIVLAKLLLALADTFSAIIHIYSFIVIIAALISFVRPDPYNPIVQILYRLTNPVYAYVRKFIPTIVNGIDLAPLIIILALRFIDSFAIELLRSFANAL